MEGNLELTGISSVVRKESRPVVMPSRRDLSKHPLLESMLQARFGNSLGRMHDQEKRKAEYSKALTVLFDKYSSL